MDDYFFYCENQEMNMGAGLVISMHPPYYIAKAYRFNTGQELATFVEKHNLQGRAGKVDGYNIILAVVSKVDDDFDPALRPVDGQDYIASTIYELQKMADFYDKERVERHKYRLAKYKER